MALHYFPFFILLVFGARNPIKPAFKNKLKREGVTPTEFLSLAHQLYLLPRFAQTWKSTGKEKANTDAINECVPVTKASFQVGVYSPGI